MISLQKIILIELSSIIINKSKCEINPYMSKYKHILSQTLCAGIFLKLHDQKNIRIYKK